MGNGTINQDQNEALQFHNQKRAEKNCQPLYWDFQLEQDAYAWAQKLAAQNSLEHSTHQSENLAWFSNQPEKPCADGTRMWFGEESQYTGGPLNRQADWTKVGHYTQAMWKDTNRIGIAHAVSGGGQTYVVAVYFPRGNYMDQQPF